MGVFALEIVARHSGEIPEQFNPIAGTNVTLTGTYPDITFAILAAAGRSTTTSRKALTHRTGLTGKTAGPVRWGRLV